MAPRGTKRNIAASSISNVSKPNWPPLQPLLSSLDLSLEETVPGQIVSVHNFFTATLCKNYVSFLSSLPLTTTPGKPKKGEAVRVNDRYQIDDSDFAERLWSQTSLKELVTGDASGLDPDARRQLWGGDVVGLNPNIRIYRYKKGQYFDQHCKSFISISFCFSFFHSNSFQDDESNNVTLPGTPPVQAKTTWTLLLYLTSPVTGCIGGETVFYPDPPRKAKNEITPDPITISLEVGMALLHRHGKDCMLHEGREVTEGEKWIIRSDLCVRR